MVMNMWAWIKKLFTRKRHSVRDIGLKQYDDTQPKRETTQSTLVLEEQGQRSLEDWGVWKE